MTTDSLRAASDEMLRVATARIATLEAELNLRAETIRSKEERIAALTNEARALRVERDTALAALEQGARERGLPARPYAEASGRFGRAHDLGMGHSGAARVSTGTVSVDAQWMQPPATHSTPLPPQAMRKS